MVGMAIGMGVGTGYSDVFRGTGIQEGGGGAGIRMAEEEVRMVPVPESTRLRSVPADCRNAAKGRRARKRMERL